MLSDSGFHAVDSEFQVRDSRLLSLKLGFRIPIISGIPDSLSCFPNSKTHDFGFQAKISWISESGFPKWDECGDAEGICQKLRCTFRVFALLKKPVVFFFYFLVSLIVVAVVLELPSNVTT